MSYDRRVHVAFQDNAWCDENVMKSWICQQWKPVCQGNMMLVLDVHKAQTTKTIQQCFRAECNTEPVLVPPGTTSLVQPVDVVFNAPFKAAIEERATTHLQDNLHQYVSGKISASERRILFTKWVGQSWEEISANKAMIVRSFEKCGISVPIDGTNDSAINISGLDNYVVSNSSEDEDDGDPFESEGDDESSGSNDSQSIDSFESDLEPEDEEMDDEVEEMHDEEEL